MYNVGKKMQECCHSVVAQQQVYAGSKKTDTIVLHMLLIISVLCLFTGCNSIDESYTQEELTSKIDVLVEQDAIEHYGRVVYLSDFPTDKLVDKDYIQYIQQTIRATQRTGVGSSASQALTPIIVDSQGVVFTPKRYNQMQDELIIKIAELSQKGQNINQEDIYKIMGKLQYHYTDIETFFTVTNLPQANSDYANSIDGLWIFDPYVKFFEKRNDVVVKDDYQPKVSL